LTIFENLAGLALYEELRWRLRDKERLHKQILKIDDNTVALWRRRGDVPGDKRDVLLRELQGRLRDDERQALQMEDVLTQFKDCVERIEQATGKSPPDRLGAASLGPQGARRKDK
jgi:hypothetical protein